MYQLLAKRGQLFAIALGVIVVALYLITVLGGLSSAGYSVSDDLVQVLKGDSGETFGFFDLGLKLTIVLIVLALAIAVLFGLFQLVMNLKGSMKGIIAMVVIAAIFFGLYSSSSTDFGSSINDTLQKFDVSENISKLISGGMKTTGLLAIVALAAMLLMEIYNMFK